MTSGIEFWVNDKGRIRLFSIAEADKITAQRLLQKKVPGIEFTTWQPLASGVIEMLKMQKGEVIEWTPHHRQ
jgi:hypothetical protein